MFKIKHERTADCVVAGFRYHKSGPIVGSLLLGLYDDDGALHHVGVSASFTMARRKELLDELAPLPENAAEEAIPGTGRARRGGGTAAGASADGTPARTCPSSRCAPSWSSRSPTTTWRASGSGTPRSSGAGVRTATRRPCTYEQLERPLSYAIQDIWGE